MRHLRNAVSAIVLLGLGLGACSSDQKSDETSGAEMKTTSSTAAVNTVCPVSHHAVEADAPTRQYQGKTVGFCCENCPVAWDKKTVAERDAMMERVAAK